MLSSVCVAAHAAQAQSLADRDWADREFQTVPAAMTAIAAPVTSSCGKPISYSFKQETFTKEYAGYSIPGNSGNAFSALAKLCETPSGKAAVTKRIDKIEIHMEKGIRGAVSLRETTLEVTLGTDGGSLGPDEIYEQLMAKL